MESVKYQVTLIAVTAIVSAVFCSLVPDGKMKAVFSVLVGIVFLCSVLTPFLNKRKPDLGFFDRLVISQEDECGFVEKSNSAARSVVERGYKTAVENAIKKLGYSFKNVTAVCDDALEIKKVIIVAEENADAEKIISEIKPFLKDAKIEIKRGESGEG